jgi:thiaminase/transcriptional activator TenA
VFDLRGFREWATLTEQPFLHRLRRGKVSDGAFERWLVQEKYLYEAMLGLQTSLLRRAPQRHRLIMANALLVTVEELDWLAHLELPAQPIHPLRQQYLDFLRGLEQAPYAMGTVAHWARHRAFSDVWGSLQRSDRPESLNHLADEIVQHWLAPEAQALIHDLGSLTLEVAKELLPDEVKRVVGRVLQLEQSAWEMALAFALSQTSDYEERR